MHIQDGYGMGAILSFLANAVSVVTAIYTGCLSDINLQGSGLSSEKLSCHLKTNSASLRSGEKFQTRDCTPCHKYVLA